MKLEGCTEKDIKGCCSIRSNRIKIFPFVARVEASVFKWRDNKFFQLILMVHFLELDKLGMMKMYVYMFAYTNYGSCAIIMMERYLKSKIFSFYASVIT